MNSSPFEQGRIDAARGHTACPYGDEHKARRWALGHDKERTETPGLLPRFGLLRGRSDRKDRLI